MILLKYSNEVEIMYTRLVLLSIGSGGLKILAAYAVGNKRGHISTKDAEEPIECSKG